MSIKLLVILFVIKKITFNCLTLCQIYLSSGIFRIGFKNVLSLQNLETKETKSPLSKSSQIVENVVIEIILPILKENIFKKNTKVEMKYPLLKFVTLTQSIPMECVTEPNIFTFETAPIKIIASTEKRLDRIAQYKIVGVRFKS